MEHRVGGKFTGKHSSLIDLACTLADKAAKLPMVKKISCGHIHHSPGKLSGTSHVKFCDFAGGILLNVRDSSSFQKIRIYTREVQETKLFLATFAANSKSAIKISFYK